MPDRLTHQPTGNPGVLDGVARMAEEMANADANAIIAAGGTLALVNILAIELADALRRISDLENPHA